MLQLPLTRKPLQVSLVRHFSFLGENSVSRTDLPFANNDVKLTTMTAAVTKYYTVLCIQQERWIISAVIRPPDKVCQNKLALLLKFLFFFLTPTL